MFPNWKTEDIVGLYGITGGIPFYLGKINKETTLEDNIKKEFFSSFGFMFEEPENLLKQEMREPEIYSGLLKALANGHSRLNELQSIIEKPSSAVSAYLSSLIALGIVKKETPVLEKSVKKTLYSLSDTMFIFYYRFVKRYNNAIVSGHGNEVFETIVKGQQFKNYLGPVFERICREYLESTRLPFIYTDIGRWWGTDPRVKAEAEIDLILANKDSALYVECKYRNEQTGIATLEKLISNSELVSKNNKYYALFSSNGFSKELIGKAKEMKNLRLITLTDMILNDSARTT